MSKPVKITTTLAEFEDLHARHQKTRGRKVEVPKDVLMRLLMDHGRLVGALERAGFEVTDGTGEAPLPVRVRRRKV